MSIIMEPGWFPQFSSRNIQLLDPTFSSEELVYLKAAGNIRTDVIKTPLLWYILQ